MSWFTQLLPPKIRALTQKKETPDHLWTKCSRCEQMLFHKDLVEHFCVCRHCDYHMWWPVKERLSHLFDEGRYQQVALPQVTADPLQFRDQKKYADRLKDARQKTGQQDAITVAFGHVAKKPLVVAVFDFSFIGGSMGLAVGEALLHAAHYAIAQKAVFMTIPSSGGARMQEGIFSLMQMPRSIIAFQMVKQAGLGVINILTNPTTGGVAASFASLGDVTLAEPGAIIGFTGARVIQETLRQPLPVGFQTAEFQQEHGFVDVIVSRTNLPSVLKDLMTIFGTPTPFSRRIAF